MLLELKDVLLPHLSVGLLAVGQLVVPLGGVLLREVVHSYLVERLQLLVLEVNGGRQVSSSHFLHLVLVDLHDV